MASHAPHPLEAKFIKLAILNQVVSPSQVQKCQELLAQRAGREAVSLEQVLQEQGFLTEDECDELWKIVARTGDTEVREQLADRIETKPGEETAPFLRNDAMPKRVKGYRIIEQIGRGGMGRVYRARQVAMDRDVALKLLPPELARNGKYIRRFIREARAAGMINHGNLVRVHDVGEADGHYFISMEYVEGRTIKQIMRREGRIGITQSLKIVEQVCAALECAHRNKIIHRDVKPDNIMITPQGAVKLCDLGLAKAMEGGSLQDSETQDGHAMGTPHYMSPEQARSSGKVDHRSDLYSLGATLYHMLTGRVPFEGETPIEVLMRVTNEPPPRPDRFEPLLPPPLTSLILRLLAKSPAERPQSAEQLRQEVVQLRADIESGRVFVFDDLPLGMKLGKPVPAPPPRPRQRWRPWAVGLAAAIVFLFLALLISAFKRSPGLPPAPAFAALEGLPAVAAGEPAPAVPASKPDQPSQEPLGRAPLHPALREELAARLKEHPEAWVDVLAAIGQLDPAALAATGGVEQARWAALKTMAERGRAASATAEFEQRQAAAETFAAAGLFRRAIETLERMPHLLRVAPGIVPLVAAEREKLRTRAEADRKAAQRALDRLLDAGLFQLALQDLERLRREAGNDGAPQERLEELDVLERRIRKLEAEQIAEHLAFEQTLAAGGETLARIRVLSAKHDLPGALGLARSAMERGESEPERLAAAAELERLKLVEKLYRKLAAAIAEQPGKYTENQFRTQAKVSGRLRSMEADHFVVFSEPGIQASVPFSSIDRHEMRALIAVVLGADLDPEVTLGKLAYDLEERFDRRLRGEVAQRAARDEPARALLDRLTARERPALRGEALNLLRDAEHMQARQRYAECQRIAGAALSLLGAAKDDVLWSRAQTLLELAAEARLEASRYPGTAAALPRGRVRVFLSGAELAGHDEGWTWQVPMPRVLPGSVLGFHPIAVRGEAPWELTGPGSLELTVLLPAGGEGRIALAVAPAGEDAGVRRILDLNAGNEAVAALHAEGREAAPWETAKLERGGAVRIWLALDAGALRWGVGEREVARAATETVTRWRVSLEGQGLLALAGLALEGAISSGLASAEERARAGMAAFQKALTFEGVERAAALLGVLEEFGAHARVASRVCTELALLKRLSGQAAERRYWESRALFECPESLRPLQAGVLLDEHRAWLEARARLGPPGVEALRQGRLEAFVLPGEMLESAGPRIEPMDETKKPQERKPGELEDEEPDLRPRRKTDSAERRMLDLIRSVRSPEDAPFDPDAGHAPRTP